MHEPRRSSRSFVTALAIAGASCAAAPALGHVGLVSPNGGEVLDVGANFMVTWEVLIQHGTQDWDLWYAHAADGPWIRIAMDLPVGDPTEGSLHTFDWTVPDDSGAEVWVRVRQDNAITDYEDVSDASFTIVGACEGDVTGDGLIGFDDVLNVVSEWGPCGPASCPADLDGDENVGFDDLLRVISRWGSC